MRCFCYSAKYYEKNCKFDVQNGLWWIAYQKMKKNWSFFFFIIWAIGVDWSISDRAIWTMNGTHSFCRLKCGQVICFVFFIFDVFRMLCCVLGCDFGCCWNERISWKSASNQLNECFECFSDNEEMIDEIILMTWKFSLSISSRELFEFDYILSVYRYEWKTSRSYSE